MKIKIVKREGIVETNSSSSHALSICMKGPLCKPGDPCWDLKIIDNILYVPQTDFGWEEFKTNCCELKLQYACGLYCLDSTTVAGQKQLNLFKHRLISFLGVKDVVFEWLTDNEDDESDEFCSEGITIDHQSIDLGEDVKESRDTFINFIFNPNSWLYGGNDNSGIPGHFYVETLLEPEDEEPEAIFYVDTDNVGEVDFPIYNIEGDPSALIRNISMDGVFFHLAFNVTTQKVEVLGSRENTSKYLQVNNSNLIIKSNRFKDLVPGILFVGDKFNAAISNIRNENAAVFLPYAKMIDQVLEDSSLNLQVGKDFVIVPLKIKSEEFGNIC